MRLKDIVEQYDGRLTEADRLLAEVLLADPKESSYLSAETIARRAGVHQSAASRLAQKLGFDSYRALRVELRREVLSDDVSADRIRKRLDHIGGRSILEGLVESELRALSALPQQIDQAQMEQAAGHLRDAGKILLFGQGHASALVDLFERRLTRSGYHVRGLRHSDWEAPDALLSLGQGDVVVAFAFRRPADRLDRVLRHAARVRATSIVISDLVGVTLRPRPDLVLAASRGGEGESQSLTVPMAICNALILELSRCDSGRSLRSLERLAALRRDLAADVAEPPSAESRPLKQAAPRQRRRQAKKNVT